MGVAEVLCLAPEAAPLPPDLIFVDYLEKNSAVAWRDLRTPRE
jgi:hypothetical protein